MPVSSQQSTSQLICITGDEHGFDEHVLRGQIKVKHEAEDVFEKMIGTGACDDCE